jgi:hypothetical protein
MSDNQNLVDTLDALYGDGVWEVSKKLSKEQKKEIGRKIGYATNLAGAVAGPAAIYMAVKGAKGNTGGIPRELSRTAGSLKRLPKVLPKTRTKVGNVARKLDNPNSKAWRTAAGVSGVSMVGLQSANWAGDTIAANTLKKPKKDVQKSFEEDPTTPVDAHAVKLKMVKAGVRGTATAAKAAPKAAASVNDKYKAIKFGPKKMAGEVAANPQFPLESVRKSVDLVVRGEISKMNEEKKQVFGWASVIEMNGEPVIDLQGDVMTIDTIEKAAYDYVHKSRKGGIQHQRNGAEPLHVSDMIESFVLTPEKKEQMGLPETTPTGWWVGFQVNDDDTWQAYKDGKLKEFSIHGSGTRKSLEV